MSQLRPALLAAILFVIAFDVAWLWQRAGGSWTSEFGGHPDEAAHVVTGLMLRDYVAAGFPGHPMAYAERYYSHYPKIGLGVWPPVFYAVQAAVTLPCGASRPALLLLMCALAATVALLVYVALRKDYGPWPATLGALLTISLPLMREYYGSVMAEMLSAAFMFGAALAWGAYLDRERTRDALLFGLLAALAILTKGTGLALALMAPLALAFTAKWHLLKRPALWGAAALTMIVAGPWTWKFREMGKGGWLHPAPTWEFSREALPYYAGKLGLALGVVLCVVAVIGLAARLRKGGATAGRWAAAAALILAVLAFQAIAPVGLEARHLIPALPAAVMFVIAGTVGVWRDRWPRPAAGGRLSIGSPAEMAALTAVLAIGLLAGWAMSGKESPRKQTTGFAPLAADVLRKLRPGEEILIASDARGEGMFIAEVALRDPARPSFKVQRASKALVPAQKDAATWRTGDARERFPSEDALVAHLTASPIRYIVVDDSLPEEKRLPYHDTLQRTVKNQIAHFTPIAAADIHRGLPIAAGQAKLYRTGPAPRPAR